MRCVTCCFSALALALYLCVTVTDARPKNRQRPAKREISVAAASQMKVQISLGGKEKRTVPVRNLNNILYCDFQILRESISQMRDTTLNNFVIGENVIRASGSSFFVLAQNRLGAHVAQMELPCITSNSRLLVPYPHFFRALSSLGLCTVDLAVNHVTISIPNDGSVMEAQPKSKEADPGSNLRNTAPDKVPAIKQRNVPPSRYQLPPDLKRRELDDSSKSEVGNLFERDSPPEPDQLSSANLASMFSALKRSPVKITRIYSEIQKKTTKIHFISASNIGQAQRHSFEKGVIKVYFRSAVNAVKSLDNIRKLSFAKVDSYIDGEEQVYVFELKSADRSVEFTRFDARHWVLVISPSNSTNSAIAEKKKWKLDVIVIDAGHGGKDAGATSIRSKFEKDITLSIALKLRAELKKKLPDMKVVLTRSTDTFIELDKRGEIANQAGGKLFISIHCNSTPAKPSAATGCETYILSPANSSSAVEVANRENSVIHLEERSERYKGMSDDQLIVATLAQNSFVKLSNTFAALVQKNLKANTSLKDRGVNQAGFIVLIGASMPGVLIETGFLSNENDEKILISSAGQQSIAGGIARAVSQYSVAYAKILKD